MNRKIKLLFVILNVSGGGVEKALINLFNCINREQYQCELLVLKKEGAFLNNIPDFIPIHEMELEEYLKHYLFTEEIPHINRKNSISDNMKYIKLFALHQLNRISKKLFNRNINLRPIFKKIKNVNEDYDVVIDYMGYASFTSFYASQVGRNRITWIHEERIGWAYRELNFVYDNFKKIFTICQDCADEYAKLYPKRANKVVVMHNIVDESEIRKKAKEMPSVNYFDEGVFNIVSVGRLTEQKSFDKAIEAAEIMREQNYKFKWIILGTGIEEKKLKQLIEDKKLEDYVIMHGFDTNPYAYMKRGNIYVQTSLAEGQCTTITEAVLLGKAVVSTVVSGVDEQLDKGKGGKIVGWSGQEIADAIIELMKDKTIIEKYEQHNENRQLANEKEMDIFYKNIQEVLGENNE